MASPSRPVGVGPGKPTSDSLGKIEVLTLAEDCQLNCMQDRWTCYALPVGGKTSLVVEPAILESETTLAELVLVAELMELTAAAEATSAARARAATLNKEESILVESKESQVSTDWHLGVPTTRHLY